MFRNSSIVAKVFPIAILVVALILFTYHAVRTLPAITKNSVIKLTHPTEYSFKEYDTLLAKYLKDGLVDYKNMKGSAELEQAVEKLSTVAPDKLPDRESRICYWINAYNLLTMKLICDKYPIDTIKQLGVERSSAKFAIGGETESLQTIYNDEILSLATNLPHIPEVVFLICNGTTGYPPLTEHALVPATLTKDARVAAYRFVRNPKNVFFDEDNGIFYISPLFRRYELYFQKIGKKAHAFAALYMNPGKAPNIDDVMLTKTYFPRVDYRINDRNLFAK